MLLQSSGCTAESRLPDPCRNPIHWFINRILLGFSIRCLIVLQASFETFLSKSHLQCSFAVAAITKHHRQIAQATGICLLTALRSRCGQSGFSSCLVNPGHPVSSWGSFPCVSTHRLMIKTPGEWVGVTRMTSFSLPISLKTLSSSNTVPVTAPGLRTSTNEF